MLNVIFSTLTKAVPSLPVGHVLSKGIFPKVPPFFICLDPKGIKNWLEFRKSPPFRAGAETFLVLMLSYYFLLGQNLRERAGEKVFWRNFTFLLPSFFKPISSSPSKGEEEVRWTLEICRKTVRFGSLMTALSLTGNVLLAQSVDATTKIPTSIEFTKKVVASENYESVGVFEVNNDGNLDLVSGGFWYEGPEYLKRHAIGQPKRYGEYYDHFSTIPLDVNGDGKMDFVTGGWFGKQLVWKENTGNADEWPEHLIAEVGNIETTRAWDLDGDGVLEILPNTPNDPLMIYRLVLDAQDKGTSKFEAHEIMGKHGHGLGFGDLNGDGRGDLIVPQGWLEAPEKPYENDWVFHEEFDLGTASVPILVTDVNADGLSDFIVGQGHGYGLHWYEQRPQKKSTDIKWKKHVIDSFNSQYHTMEWDDLDGDGINELITGKRYKAHNGKDPGGNDPIGLYYFRWTGKHFSKQVIDYGAYGEGKGTGVYFCVSDLNADKRKDIIVAGKDGLTIYYNNGNK